jgi:hypothetical protein
MTLVLRESMFQLLKRGMLLGAALVLSVGTSQAQTMTTGAINGVVTDPSGAVLPGATVTITQEGTGATKTVKSDASGHYSSDEMKPGKYTVERKHSELLLRQDTGFRSAEPNH